MGDLVGVALGVTNSLESESGECLTGVLTSSESDLDDEALEAADALGLALSGFGGRSSSSLFKNDCASSSSLSSLAEGW